MIYRDHQIRVTRDGDAWLAEIAEPDQGLPGERVVYATVRGLFYKSALRHAQRMVDEVLEDLS